jgi:hypothetical protein
MTRAAVGRASILAAILLLLVPLGGQHSTAFAASAACAATLALWTAAAHYTGVVPPAGTAGTTREFTAWSSAHETVLLPQRDPDAAGKPRPRAPGANPRTV